MATPIELLLGMHAAPTDDPAEVAAALRGQQREAEALGLSTIDQVSRLGQQRGRNIMAGAQAGGRFRRAAQARADRMARQEVMDERYGEEQAESRRRWEAGHALRRAAGARAQETLDLNRQNQEARLQLARDKLELQRQNAKNKADADRAKAALKQANEFDELRNDTNTGIDALQNLENAIDAGAYTGYVQKLLNPLTTEGAVFQRAEAQLTLENVKNAGLKPVSDTDLRYVGKASVPVNADESYVKAWANKKREGRERYLEAVTYVTEQRAAEQPVDDKRVEDILYGPDRTFTYADPDPRVHRDDFVPSTREEAIDTMRARGLLERFRSYSPEQQDMVIQQMTQRGK